MTHPLTDKIMNQIRDSIPPLMIINEQGHRLSYDGQRVLDGMFEEDDEITLAEMRSVADWQLEQVVEWLRENLDERYIFDGDVLAFVIDVGSVVIDLKQAMRPTTTTTQENN